MMKNLITLFLSLLMTVGSARAAEWIAQRSGTTVRFRGVSAVNSRVAWASGDKGTFARTVDGGRTWKSATVPGATDLDFRDIDAFDANTAYMLSIGEGDKSRIYKTTNGGREWVLQFKSERREAFFDAMAFWDRDHGIAVSDPVNGRFLIIYTNDGGKHWQEMPREGMPEALPGEGAFAASGTCITVEGKQNVWFGTGGEKGARVFYSQDRGRTWAVANTPLVKGKSAGVFSLTFWNESQGVVVGGDYTKEGEAKDSVAVTEDGGKSWNLATVSLPSGYRSCVVLVPKTARPVVVTVGPNGSEYSLSGGRSWTSIDTGKDTAGFHAVSFAGEDAGWAVGEAGRIAKYRGMFIIKAKR